MERCHLENVSPLSCSGIITRNELLHQLARLGFHVRSIEWSTLKEKETGHKLKNYIKEEIMKNLALKEHVKIRKAKRNFYVHLPVVTIRGEKRL
jgi:hypothetical protein